MTRWNSRVWIVVLLAAGLSACLEQTEATGTQALPLEGTWHVRAIERHHGCPELGSLAPVDPGSVTFSREGAAWFVRPTHSDQSVLYQELEPDVWGRSVNASYEGCDLHAESRWSFDGIIESGFSATYTAVFGLSGDGCELPRESCTVDYAVTGRRLP